MSEGRPENQVGEGTHRNWVPLSYALSLWRELESLRSATAQKPNDAAFRIERTMHIYNETLCAVKHEDLDRLEMALDTALRQAAELRAQPANARAVAEKVEDLVRGLVDQQAMPDKWWQEPLAEILSALLDATLPEAPQPATARSGMAMMHDESPTVGEGIDSRLNACMFRDRCRAMKAALSEKTATPDTASSALQEAVNIGLAALGYYNTEQTDAHWNEQEKRLRALETLAPQPATHRSGVTLSGAMAQWANDLKDANLSPPNGLECISFKAGFEAALSETPAGGTAKVPEGWKLVPVEPTPYMVVAAIRCLAGVNLLKQAPTNTGRAMFKAEARYRAMLAAAPSPDGNEEKGK
jgi:hypothetical protein